MFVINRMLITGACYEYRLFYSKVHTFKKTNCSNNCDMYTENFSFIVFFCISTVLHTGLDMRPERTLKRQRLTIAGTLLDTRE